MPPEDLIFEVRIETDLKIVYKLLQKTLQIYKDEKKGPTLLAIQTTMNIKELQQNIPSILDFPVVPIHVQVSIQFFQLPSRFLRCISFKKSIGYIIKWSSSFLKI